MGEIPPTWPGQPGDLPPQCSASGGAENPADLPVSDLADLGGAGSIVPGSLSAAEMGVRPDITRPADEKDHAPADDRPQLVASCLGTVQTSLEEAANELAESGMTGFVHGRAEIICEEAQVALAEEGVEAFESRLGLVGEAGPSVPEDFVETCRKGIDAGSQLADMLLNDTLNAEKATIEESLRKAKDDPEHWVDDDAPLLRAVVRAHEAEDKPAEVWINRYAAHAPQRWAITFEHRQQLVEQCTDETQLPARQAALSNAAAALMDPELPDAFVFVNAARAASVVQDTDVKRELVGRFWKAGAHVPLDLESIKKLADMGTVVLGDKQVEMVYPTKRFDAALGQAVALYAEEGYALGLKAKAVQMGWNIEKKRAAGASPDELVEEIKQQTSQLADAVRAAGERGPFDGFRHVIETSDMHMGNHAARYAAAGDFGAARYLLSHVSSEGELSYAIKNCIEHAKDISQLEQLRFPADTAAMYPDAGLQIDIATAVRAGDVDTLINLAAGCLETFRDDGQLNGLGYSRDIFLAVKEISPQAATTLARRLVEISRREGISLYKHWGYSQWLISQGDIGEARAAYNEIQNAADDPFALMNSWRLARTLANARQQ